MDDQNEEGKNIPLPEAIFVGGIIFIVDIADVFVGEFFVTDILAWSINLYLKMKGVKQTYAVIGNILEFVPFLGLLPLRTAAFIAVVYAVNHPEKFAAAQAVAGVAKQKLTAQAAKSGRLKELETAKSKFTGGNIVEKPKTAAEEKIGGGPAESAGEAAPGQPTEKQKVAEQKPEEARPAPPTKAEGEEPFREEAKEAIEKGPSATALPQRFAPSPQSENIAQQPIRSPNTKTDTIDPTAPKPTPELKPLIPMQKPKKNEGEVEAEGNTLDLAA